MPVQPTDDSATHFNTRAVHAGMEPDPATGAVMTPCLLYTSDAADE